MMRMRNGLLTFAVILGVTFLGSAKDQKLSPLPAKLLAAKSVYFDNRTGFTAVGDEALRELMKWGRFQVVQRKEDAQLVLVLSTREYDDNPPRAPSQNAALELGSIHLHVRPAEAYLTAVDATTGQKLWFDSRQWGGLLTGFNSAGRRLIDKLRKQIEVSKE